MCTMQNALCLQNCNFGSLFFQESRSTMQKADLVYWMCHQIKGCKWRRMVLWEWVL
jgi:hypothetical protein